MSRSAAESPQVITQPDGLDHHSSAGLQAGPDLPLRSHRLVQLARLVMLGLLVAGLASAWEGDGLTASVLAGGFALVGASTLLNRFGATQLASLGILWSLTLLAATAMWFNQGLYSPAMLVFPCVLVIANMLARLRHFVLLLAFMILAMAAMVGSSIGGWRHFSVAPAGWAQLIYAVVILVVFAVMVAMLAGDLRRALKALQAEVVRANKAREQIQYQATHDALTGLPNRLACQMIAQRAMAYAAKHGRQVALVYVNIDNFKHVNDSLGHRAGDELLRQAALRLQSNTRGRDTVARLGGDEFLLLLSDLGEANEAAAMASHVLSVMVEPFQFESLPIGISCSIGIALFPGDGRDFEGTMQKANIAVHHAKEAGRNVFRFFDERMNANMLEDLNISTSLRGAIERGEFHLHYQPLIDLASGHLIGAEALLRWDHPERGSIPPGRFIPVAERSGQVVELGQWVLNEACSQVRAWRGTRFEGLVVSVNVSTVQFKRGTLEAMVSAALERYGVPAGSIELEVTESALIHDPETFVETLHSLKRLGLRLSIDDFGTGYSNLSYLQRFEIDKLKIDQSFVRRLSERPQDRAIVRAIIQMAKSLNLVTTGEGIEDDATLAHLVELGCDQGQGFILGRPMSAGEFEQAFAGRLKPLA